MRNCSVIKMFRYTNDYNPYLNKMLCSHKVEPNILIVGKYGVKFHLFKHFKYQILNNCIIKEK